MKKFISFLATAGIFVLLQAQNQDSRTLFTVGGDQIPVSEFQYVYNKNNINNQADYSEKSLRDYLNLYENFRLKVKEAEALKLDTIASLNTELDGYRKQLAKSYLTDREISDKLISEAYERSKTELNASHILIRCDENANPADTLAAYKKIMALKKRIDKGESFEKVAKEASEDPSAKTNDGNIGWFTVFGTIYPFENTVYAMKKGEISQPVRTEFGYHLVKLNNTRPARGQIRVAHILIHFPENATQKQKDSLRLKADSVYQLIQSGKIPFEEAVRTYSDDRATRVKGGELQSFGSGTSLRMVPQFEDAAFELKKDGDISKPIMTQYGWHIIRRLEKTDLPSFADAKADIKKKVERDSRSQEAKNVLIARIKKENNYTPFADNKAKFIAKADSTVMNGNWRADSGLRNTSPIFSLGGKNYTVNDFIDFIEKNSHKRSDKGKEALLNEYYENFVNNKCLEHEESLLETKKPEFKNLMKEYKDGILLFELMDRMVWTKAVKDTMGLEEFRKKNESKYMWGNRVEAEIYNCNNKKLCDEAAKMAQKNKSPEEVKSKLNKAGSLAQVSAIEGKYEKGQYDVVDSLDWKEGVSPVVTLNDSSFRFVRIKKILGPEPKSLKEAKGYVVSDYQEYLEKTWLADLRSKYPIKVDETVFRSLIKK
ncbi:MAG: peptidylprolyl isomerase [Bacteroidetes bacterium]|nr:peptidylprolyl isomerase [Bacteroidota bacterium]